MIEAVAIAIWVAVVLVYASRFMARHRRQPTLDAAALMRCIRTTTSAQLETERLARENRQLAEARHQAQLEAQRLARENEQLAELAAKRHELLRLACLALELAVPDRSRDTELLQAVRAAALLHTRSIARLQHAIVVREDALAAVAGLALETSVQPGQ